MLLPLNMPARAHSYGPQVDFDYQPYVKDVEARVKKHWHPSKSDKSPEVQIKIQFKILPDGRLQEAHVRLSSGNEKADKAALKAVKKAAPFLPLPITGANPCLELCISFDREYYKDGIHCVIVSA
jgi:TonB family protein